MREEMETIDWNDLLKEKDTEEMWNAFKQKLENLTNKYIPFKQRRSGNKTPWCNNEIKRIIRIKQQRYQKMKKSKSKEDAKEYKKSQQQISPQISKQKQQLVL